MSIAAQVVVRVRLTHLYLMGVGHVVPVARRILNLFFDFDRYTSRSCYLLHDCSLFGYYFVDFFGHVYFYFDLFGDGDLYLFFFFDFGGDFFGEFDDRFYRNLFLHID